MSGQPDEDEEFVDSRRAQLFERADVHNVPLRTIFATVATVVVVYATSKLLFRLRDVLLLMVVGAFLALILNPMVVMLQRWKIHRRGFAVAIVALLSILVFFGLAVAFGYPLVHSVTHLANALPNYVDKAQHGNNWIGRLLRRYNVASWTNKNSSKLISLAKGLSRPALALGKGAVSALLALLTTFTFVVLLLLEAPKMRTALLKMMSPERAARLSRLSAEVSRAAAGYVLGNFLTSVVAGAVVFVTLMALSVPFAFLWALWVALVDFLPVIGGALAGIPTVLFALAHSITAGVITAIVFLIYTQFENHVLVPVVMSRTVRINPLTVFTAVLFGVEVGSWVGGMFGGFIGVLLAVPAAAAIQVLVREIWTSTAPSPFSWTHAPDAPGSPPDAV
jgi:predicted PurR-regulated permease PerM